MLRLVVQLVAGTPRRIDGLCCRCLLPALIEVPVLSLTLAGVTPFGVTRWCTDCQVSVPRS